jgi:hypothetical protein
MTQFAQEHTLGRATAGFVVGEDRLYLDLSNELDPAYKRRQHSI